MTAEAKYQVGIIGAGIMGEAILDAISKGDISPASIALADIRTDRLIQLRHRYGCFISNVKDVAQKARNIMLVVKPQDMDSLLREIGESISTSQRVISFVAGKKTSYIEGFLKKGTPVVRVMPNTPISVGIGASAISPGDFASNEDIKSVQELLKASGKIIQVDESLQDAVTATSGSGPAYFFRIVEAMINGAKDLGLSENDAKTLVIQTITGAAAMLNLQDVTASKLRENVTSPNGTTSAALQIFEEYKLEAIVKEAMLAAKERSRELSE